MECLGYQLSYISSIVIKKNKLLTSYYHEYIRYAEYGLSFLYSVYNGVYKNCNAIYLSTPLVYNRSENSDYYDWYKYFIVGTTLVFEDLLKLGYTKKSIRIAKYQVLKKLVVYRIYFARLKNDIDRKKLAHLIFKFYNEYSLFWFICIPLLYTPIPFLRIIKMIIFKIRSIKK